MGEFSHRALSINTCFISPSASPIRTGILGLMIPAFSLAISGKVFPKNCTWSKLIFVIILRSGVIIFVLSNRPPNPTSMTATSTLHAAK